MVATIVRAACATATSRRPERKGSTEPLITTAHRSRSSTVVTGTGPTGAAPPGPRPPLPQQIGDPLEGLRRHQRGRWHAPVDGPLGAQLRDRGGNRGQAPLDPLAGAAPPGQGLHPANIEQAPSAVGGPV